MSPARIAALPAAGLGLAALTLLPLYADAYYLALAIGLLQFTVLATAWGLFSGPTRYVSLATTAFFGVGAYTVAVLGEVLAWPLVLADRCRDRRADGRHRRGFDAAAQRPSLRHLHLRTGGADASARDLVRGQQDPCARPLRVRRYHPERHLLAASRACRRGICDRLADRRARGSALRCASSARTKPSQDIAGSTSRSPRSHCLRSAPSS